MKQDTQSTGDPAALALQEEIPDCDSFINRSSDPCCRCPYDGAACSPFLAHRPHDFQAPSPRVYDHGSPREAEGPVLVLTRSTTAAGYYWPPPSWLLPVDGETHGKDGGGPSPQLQVVQARLTKGDAGAYYVFA
ncbi:unnamed protein product [Urochloa humidicola]